MFDNIIQNLIADGSGVLSALLDSAMSLEGIGLVAGSTSVLVSSTMLYSYRSGGKKDWLTGPEAQKCGLFDDPKRGFILGRYKGRLVCYAGDMNVGINGTTRTGKTACAFLATLLSNERFSFIVFDQKGSLYELTSGRRAKFGPVYRLDPSKADTACYNPFDDLPDDDRLVSALETMYSVLAAGSSSDQKKTGGDPFFDKKPREVFPFIGKQVLHGDDDSKKNIGGVLNYMSDGKSCFVDMVNNPRCPQCESVGRDMLSLSEATRSSIMTTMKAAFSLWRDDSVARMTNKSSFHIEDLALTDEDTGPITIYLTAPPFMTQRLMPFYVLMEEMLKLRLMSNTKLTLSGKKKIRDVCIVDDEAQNSKRPNIDMLEIATEYKISYFLGYQSLQAMSALYGEPKLELIKLNVSYRPTTGKEVVKSLVKMSGTYKKKVISHSESHGGGRGGSSTRNWKIEETPRMNESDLERLPPYGRALLTHTEKPVLLKTFDSKRDRQFKKLILPEYVPSIQTFVAPAWANVSRPIVRSGQPAPAIQEEESYGEEGIEHDTSNTMMMLGIGGFGIDAGEEAMEEEEVAPPPKQLPGRKRKVSF